MTDTNTSEIDPAEIPDLTQLDTIGDDLIPMMNRLREKEPVVWNPSVHAWMLLRHEDVLKAYQGKFPLSSRAINPERIAQVVPDEDILRRIPNIVKRVPAWVVNADDPYHRRVRTVMAKGFTPRIIEGVRTRVREIVEEALAGLQGQVECDFNQVMREVTVRTIMHVIGIPDEQFENVSRWSDAITDSFTRPLFNAETLERSDTAFAEMTSVLAAEIAARRSDPRDDFLTHLVKAADEGQAMTEDELISQLIFLLPAGHDSTTNTMTLSLVALLRHPEWRRRFEESESERTNIIVELMRIVAMSATSNRIATEDFELHGKQIKKGDMLLLLIVSANRDPRAFENPESFEPDRPNALQLVFGHGQHHCLGHLLAKLEISEMLPATLRAFPDIALIDEHIDFSTAFAFRGLEHLHVRLTGEG
jgi:cytochrome P450